MKLATSTETRQKLALIAAAALTLTACAGGLAGPVTPSTGQQVIDRLDCRDIERAEYDLGNDSMPPYVVITCTPTVIGVVGPMAIREYRSPAAMAASMSDEARMCVAVSDTVTACPEALADLPALMAALAR